MAREWKVFPLNERLQKTLTDEFGITPVLAQLLLNRGINTVPEARYFLFGSLADCHDPFLMKDMAKAVTRIKTAVEKSEKVLIYGDYDADGVSATALLSEIFDFLGAKYETFIPNRIDDGYGMNVRAVAKAREDGVKLIVTVDCGTNSQKEIICANDYGIDVVVTDHHEVRGESVPPAFAIVNPHQASCVYPYKELAGVGVAYKLCMALLGDKSGDVYKFLDLVAVGTVADVVPLTGENRILVKEGLRKINSDPSCGLKALMEVAKLKKGSVGARQIGFVIAPRINAMGRLSEANTALKLLVEKDAQQAGAFAEELDKENSSRRTIEKDLLNIALEEAKRKVDPENDKAVVLAGDAWHVGVIGLVASKLSEVYNVPAVVISTAGDEARGSGRSIDGINLFEAVKKTGEFLVTFGGHEGACGIRIKKENIDNFRKALNNALSGQLPASEKTVPDIRVDMKIPFSQIGLRLLKEINALTPFGLDNPEPVFVTQGVAVKNSPRDIGDGKGFKFFASCGTMVSEVITFDKKRFKAPARGSLLDIAYTPQENSWGGIDTVQLNLKDMREAS
ncbi:MAG: single-stranded-DNA-specific exonuclease RecJ [Candidatus Omnitrophica bacterium]|nr:single-stranded-DNA-specific exonuclease RecJ [Candidatus Omnitrophota bacterium]